jgi:Flp pilus assembly pilin Flp
VEDEIGLSDVPQPNALVLPKRGARGAAAVEYGALVLFAAVLIVVATHTVGADLSGIFALAATSL